MSRRKHQLRVLYIPGLGDGYELPIKIALIFWRLYGVHAELVPMKWLGEASYDAKYRRVVDAIKRAEKKGYRVSLVGASAGASMALNVFADHPSVEQVVTICGVNSPNTPVHEELGRRHPGFLVSLKKLRESLKNVDRSKITVVYPRFDSIVPRRHTLIEGASHVVIQTEGHSRTIALTVSIYSYIPIRILKKQHTIAK